MFCRNNHACRNKNKNNYKKNERIFFCSIYKVYFCNVIVYKYSVRILQ